MRNSMDKKLVWWSVVAICGVVPSAALVACNSVSPDGKTWISTPEPDAAESDTTENEAHGAPPTGEPTQEDLGAVRQAIDSGAQKICSTFISGNWSDTVNVPQTWSRAKCLVDYKAMTGARGVRLGCLTPTSFSIATCDNCLPANNACGW
jgi:hypothetical protein